MNVRLIILGGIAAVVLGQSAALAWQGSALKSTKEARDSFKEDLKIEREASQQKAIADAAERGAVTALDSFFRDSRRTERMQTDEAVKLIPESALVSECSHSTDLLRVQDEAIRPGFFGVPTPVEPEPALPG